MKYDNAAILVTVYNRIEHFTKCIESLKRCTLANQTDLYIASDGAKYKEDEADIIKIRKFINNIDGFKQVFPIIREKNYGMANNSHIAKEFIYNNNEKLVTLEDDVLVGKNFLKFMNEGLDYYRYDDRVVAVAGYLPAEINNIFQAPFITNLFSPYGFGMWREKWEYLTKLRDKRLFHEWISDVKKFKIYEQSFPELVRALPLIIDGGWRLGDVEYNLIMQNSGKYVLFPPASIS
jgi:glycosyltransferase involved in cell wall biosynthesis